MSFARKQDALVLNLELREVGAEAVRVLDGDYGVGFAVDDEGGWERCGGLCFVRRGETARDFDDCADALGRTPRGQCERKERAQGDAQQGDALGVDCGTGGNSGERVSDCFEPERNVYPIGEMRGTGALGSGAVEVVCCVDCDAGSGRQRSDAVEPEANVSSGAV